MELGTYGGANSVGRGMINKDSYITDNAPTTVYETVEIHFVGVGDGNDGTVAAKKYRELIKVVIDPQPEGAGPIRSLKIGKRCLAAGAHAHAIKIYTLASGANPDLQRCSWTNLLQTSGGHDPIPWTAAGGDRDIDGNYHFGNGIIEQGVITGAAWQSFYLDEYMAEAGITWGSTFYLLFMSADEATAGAYDTWASSEYTTDTTHRPYIEITHDDAAPSVITDLSVTGDTGHMDANDAYETVPRFTLENHTFESDVEKYYLMMKTSFPADPSDGTKQYVAYDGETAIQDIEDFGLTDFWLVNSGGTPIAPTEATKTYYWLVVEDSNNTGADATMSNVVVVNRPAHPTALAQEKNAGAWGNGSTWDVFQPVRIRCTVTGDDWAFKYKWGDGKESAWLTDAVETMGTYQYREHNYEDTEYEAAAITSVLAYAKNTHGFSSDATTVSVTVSKQTASVTPRADVTLIPRRRKIRLHAYDLIMGRAGNTISTIDWKYTSTGAGIMTIGTLDNDGFDPEGNKITCELLVADGTNQQFYLIGLDENGHWQEEQVTLPAHPGTVDTTNDWSMVIAVIADEAIKEFQLSHKTPGSGTIGKYISAGDDYYQFDTLHVFAWTDIADDYTVTVEVEDDDTDAVSGTIDIVVKDPAILDINQTSGDWTDSTVGGRKLGRDWGASFGPTSGQRVFLDEMYNPHYGVPVIALVFDGNHADDVTLIFNLWEGVYDWAVYTLSADSEDYLLKAVEAPSSSEVLDGTDVNIIWEMIFAMRKKLTWYDAAP